jgi:hypothetical protein
VLVWKFLSFWVQQIPENIVVLRINYVDVAIGFELFFRVHRQRSDSLMFADISIAAPAAGVLLVDTTAFR